MQFPSRWNEAIGAGKTPQLPSVAPLSYMVDMFRQVGKSSADGGPVSYCELEAFARIEGGVTADDLKLLRAMSVAYVNEIGAGRDVFAEAPWDGE